MGLYRIAGLTVQMDTFGRIERQAAPYAIDSCEQPDMRIVPETQHIRGRYPSVSEDECEYMATGVSFYRQLLWRDGLMLHASAVVLDGKAYLFSADSGTGKSTHTALWQQVFGADRALILNDDKPALRLEDGVWYAYGTPWSGKTDQSKNLRVPVAGIALLGRADQNRIQRFGGLPAVMALMRQVNKPNDAGMRGKMLELLDRLITKVPVWQLHCNMDPHAATVAFEAMSGATKEDDVC